MNLIKPIFILTLGLVVLSACGGNAEEAKPKKQVMSPVDKGNVVIKLEGKTYTLPIQLCTASKEELVNDISGYVINASDPKNQYSFTVTEQERASASAMKLPPMFNFKSKQGLFPGENYAELAGSQPKDAFNGISLAYEGKAMAFTVNPENPKEKTGTKSVEIVFQVDCKK